MKYIAACVLTVAAIVGVPPAQGQSAPPAPSYGQDITLDRAEKLADRAVLAAATHGFTMAVAVVDTHGELIVFHRMDDTQIGSNTVAVQKARTAALFKRPTKVFYDALASGRTAVLSTPGVIAVEGGIPIMSAGKIVGAIGVSGGSAIEDGQIATSALDVKTP